MTAAEVFRQDLLSACASLFDPDIELSVEFLRHLEPAGVKAAFRKKALETHPDRAVILAGAPDFLEKRFKEISRAYRLLQEFLASPRKYSLTENETICRHRPSSAPHGTCRHYARQKSEQLYTGRMPQRSLLFGQYLYYAGHISFSLLVKAIVWQKLQRPSIGTIAVSWGWMEGGNVTDILRCRKYGERFGECALRCGYLSTRQLILLLNKQRTIQPRLGKYFAERGMFTSLQLCRMREEMRKHNGQFERCRRDAYNCRRKSMPEGASLF